ncbi:MAG TPA: RraA family protein [Firmicutes bacterium]|nr:RraA family protein [Bacillota bacterium]
MSDRVMPEYRIRADFDRPDKQQYEELINFACAGISDAFRKRQTLPTEVKPLYAECPRIVGPALPVHATPGDELLALKAIEVAKPGDVIVVAGVRSEQFSFWGGIMSLMAQKRQVAGLVTDGQVRDLEEIKEIKFPVYCTGHLPTAPCMDVPPGDLGYPMPFGRVIVSPGDIVVADPDGVVIVPKDYIAAVIEAVKNRVIKEEGWQKQIEATKEMILSDTVKAILARRTVDEK